jgi:hypothetical protein
MSKSKIAALAALSLISFQGCVIQDSDNWASCARGHRLQVVDLDMSPDPVADGQRINQFRVSLRSDGADDCATYLQIRETEGNDLIATERVYRLRPGINQIRIEPDGRYRFSRQEHCFNVIANIENNSRPVDTARRFCARQVGGKRWSLSP